jgi:dihydrofolate reductase
MLGKDGGAQGPDDDFAARSFVNIGACIMGRNMFGPIRGPWTDTDWKGWWGDDPPYHAPVFVLTHHPRASITMKGGTTFHFITDGPLAALERAYDAANGKDVRLSGGVETVRHYLKAGLVDELHIAIAPVLLGTGENLFSGIDLPALGYRWVEHLGTRNATHVIFRKVLQGSE